MSNACRRPPLAGLWRAEAASLLLLDRQALPLPGLACQPHEQPVLAEDLRVRDLRIESGKMSG